MIDYFTYITEIEQENLELSQINLQQDLQNYEVSVGVLARTLNQINKAFSVAEGKRLEPESKIATVLLASRFMVSSRCIFNILVKGYYFEAWILMRNLQENVADCLCFAESNDYAKLWFEKRLSTRVAFKKIRKVIQASHRKHLKDARDFMNEFSHSKMPAVARFVKFEGKQIIKPQERPEFQKKANLLFRAFRTLNASLLLILVELFKDDLNKKTKDIVTKFVSEAQKDL